MGPKMITHIFIIWELISQLHRTSVTQGLLAGIVLCNSGASITYFLCTCQLHTLNFWNYFSGYTRTSVTEKNCFRIVCVIISGLIVYGYGMQSVAGLLVNRENNVVIVELMAANIQALLNNHSDNKCFPQSSPYKTLPQKACPNDFHFNKFSDKKNLGPV